MSPTFTNSGTWITAPVSSVAGFVTFETVSPFTPGSVSVTSSTTDDGSSTPDGCSADEHHLHARRRLHERQLVLEVRVRQRQLLVGLLVHEDDLVARVVEVLHVLRLGADAVELLARAERPVDDRAGGERLQLRADERAALAGLDVLELDDAPRLALELDVHPVPELVGGDDLGHRRVRVANA